MEIVQLHERKWGDTQYPGRPTLADLMKFPIVVMWRIDKRFILSAHQSPDEVHDLALKALTGKLDDSRKLEQIFVNHQPIVFGIRIVSEQPEQPQAKSADKPKAASKRIQPDDIVFVPASVIPDGKPIKRGDIVIREAKDGDILPGRNVPLKPMVNQGQKKTKKHTKT